MTVHYSLDSADVSPFVTAILRAVDNPEGYFVFADWLEEQGDPRGELIRVQWELEFPSLSASRRRELKQVESELLKQFSDVWLGDLAPMFLKNARLPSIRGAMARPFVWQFQRGFPDSLQVSSFPPGFCGILRASSLPRLLRSLSIRHPGGRGIAERECADLGSTLMPNLRGLELVNFLGVEPYLSLSGNESLRRLESLVIEPVTAVPDISGLCAFFRNPALTNIRHLTLSSAGNDAIVEELTSSDLFFQLESLDLSFGSVTDDGIHLLIEAGLDHLADLNVSLNLLTEEGMLLLEAEHPDAVIRPQTSAT